MRRALQAVEERREAFGGTRWQPRRLSAIVASGTSPSATAQRLLGRRGRLTDYCL